MTVDIICPIYNASKYLENLNNSILMQEEVKINKIEYILTESEDDTEQLLIDNHCNYKKIKREEFSHSLVRERAVVESNADIVVFITQDVIIKEKKWLYNLTKDIDDEIVATYSRQIAKDNGLEKYVRQINYPANSKIVSKYDIPNLGLKTFFFSDASSAIKRDVFVQLNGYDNKKLPISEDMYIAYKIIMNGYKIKYCADSIVIHSHNLKLRELYERYKLTGKFFKENSYLDEYNTNKTGSQLAKYVLKQSLKELNIKVLIRFPLDMAVRFIGMKAGKK